MTQYVGLIGYPLSHSLSPIFQQAAFDYLGLDIRYQTWEIEAGNLKEVVERLRRPLYLGANVTIPYKEGVLGLVDQLDELARGIGAVNTIVNRDGQLIGFNTDAAGFMRALREDGGFEPRGKEAVILGAGGGARAAGFALVREGIGTLAIVNRTLDRAQVLAEHLKAWGSPVVALPWEEKGLRQALSRCQLLVNATSVGMRHSPTEGQSPLRAELIPKDALVYDLVYNPIETPILKEAKRAGAATLGGLGMLIYQGAASFELWTGRAAPIDIMFQAARQGLGVD